MNIDKQKATASLVIHSGMVAFSFKRIILKDSISGIDLYIGLAVIQ